MTARVRKSSSRTARPQEPARRRGRPRAEPGDDDSRRHQLLRASARLFREKGYDGTSVRDIAQATGLQSGSWVYHFPTKQDILVAVMEQGLVDALARIEAIAAQDLPPRPLFEALVRTHLDTILAPGQDFIPVVLYEWRSLAAPARRRVTALLKRYEAVWRNAIAALQRTGDWPGRTRIDVLLLFGALNWMARWYQPRGEFDIDTLARECVAFFLRAPVRRRRRAAS
ncbi:MAG TPA: TetR/AcrR family transcriptional regulator [Steroidobacteraceae bacterium]